LFPAAVFVVSRLCIATLTYASLVLDPRMKHGPAMVSGWVLVDGLARWDSAWFGRLADSGYTFWFDPNFFPLFPLLGRGVGQLTGWHPLANLLLVANLAGLAALVAVFAVFRRMTGESVARTALVTWAVWPFSFFHAAAYPETLMILATASAVLLAARHRHAAAGAAMGVGILARHLSALVWLSVAWYARQPDANQTDAGGIGQRAGGFWQSLAVRSLAVASLCVLPWFVFCQVRFGNPLQWAMARGHWGAEAWWGVWSIPFFAGARQPQLLAYTALSIVPGIGAFALLRKPQWRGLAPFAIGLMVLSWLTGLSGLGRYGASCWAAFLPVGAMLAGRPGARWAWWALSAAGQAAVLYLFSHGYEIT
jgi:hypothetical protein